MFALCGAETSSFVTIEVDGFNDEVFIGGSGLTKNIFCSSKVAVGELSIRSSFYPPPVRPFSSTSSASERKSLRLT